MTRDIGYAEFDDLTFRVTRALTRFDEGQLVAEIAAVVREPLRCVNVALHVARRKGFLEKVSINGARGGYWYVTLAGRAYVRAVVAGYRAQVERDIADQEAEHERELQAAAQRLGRAA